MALLLVSSASAVCITRQYDNYLGTAGTATILEDDGVPPACDLNYAFLNDMASQYPGNVANAPANAEAVAPTQWASIAFNRIEAFTNSTHQTESLVANRAYTARWRKFAMENSTLAPHGFYPFGFGANGFIRPPVLNVNTRFPGEGDLGANPSHSERVLRDAFFPKGSTNSQAPGGTFVPKIVGGIANVADFYLYTTFTPCADYCSRDISLQFYNYYYYCKL